MDLFRLLFGPNTSEMSFYDSVINTIVSMNIQLSKEIRSS